MLLAGTDFSLDEILELFTWGVLHVDIVFVFRFLAELLSESWFKGKLSSMVWSGFPTALGLGIDTEV